MREGEGTDDVCYRTAGKEVLAYIHEMVDHELVDVRTCTACLHHDGSGGTFTVSTSRGLVNARALAFAPGAHETTAGSPH